MEAFHCRTKIITGQYALQALKDLHIKRMMLVCDPFFHKNGTVDHIIAAAGHPECEIFSQIVPDPSVHLAAQGAAIMQQLQPDTVVALGGGSTMDSAKAMRYFSGLNPQLIAIPTTSGSGSEMTDYAILTHNGTKHPLVDESLRPEMAILDSQLVATIPPSLVADGGFDLISHALEAYVAKNRSCISNLLAAEAFSIASADLLSSFRGETNAREQLHLAATMAGLSFSQAGLGMCHAIAHSIGGEFHTPHGRLNAILLPAVLEENGMYCCQQYAKLARIAGLSCGSDAMAFRALKSFLLRLRRSLQLPETLTQAGIERTKLEEKLDRLVHAALADPCCATNPVVPTEAMIRKIITSVAGHG